MATHLKYVDRECELKVVADVATNILENSSDENKFGDAST